MAAFCFEFDAKNFYTEVTPVDSVGHYKKLNIKVQHYRRFHDNLTI